MKKDFEHFIWVNINQQDPLNLGCDATFRDRKHRKKKKESLRPKPFSCQLCQRSFSKQLLLDKHSAYHVEEHRPCHVCGKVFDKKWQLQQHIAIEHEQPTELQCQVRIFTRNLKMNCDTISFNKGVQ
jgi:hypothetical protein